MREVTWRRILGVSLVFAVIHTCFFLSGGFFGDLFVGFVEKFAPVIGFALLAYVGGALLVAAWRDDLASRDLGSFRNILLCAVATSIDAFAAGISLAMDRDSVGDMVFKAAVLFVVTVLTVGFGISSGQAVGRRYGRWAQFGGGLVLLCIGLNILVKAFWGPVFSI